MAHELAPANEDDFLDESAGTAIDATCPEPVEGESRAQYQGLIEQYAYLVKAAVNRVDRCLPPEVDRGVLVGRAIMALIDTAYRTPPGQLFEQQAKSNIWKSIVKWLGGQPWLRKRLKEAADKLYEAHIKVSQHLDSPVAAPMLAQELHVTEAQLEQWLNEVNTYFTAWPRSFLGVENGAHGSHRVAMAIAKLPPRARLVVTLSHYEELSHDEIAQILNVPVEEVSRTYAETGLHLRALLAEAA